VHVEQFPVFVPVALSSNSNHWRAESNHWRKMRIKPGMNWGWRVQIQFETNADVQGTATGGDRVAWYQSSLILACRMSQAVAWQHMVYVLHSLMLHCGPTWKGSWTCFLPLGCYH